MQKLHNYTKKTGGKSIYPLHTTFLLYNTFMNFFKKLDEANTYLSFNIFTICGWLYLPILIWVIHFKPENYYPIVFYLPLTIFLLVPWLITTIALIIFLIESLKINHLHNNFCITNKYFKAFKYIGLLITIIFYLILVFYNPYSPG